jgi:dTDP-4-amino-4,6-dideoxygalactose transaminase
MPFDCPVWPPQWPEIELAIGRVLRSGEWGRYHSATCKALEKRLIETFQASHAKLCCSGTAALEIALRALQIDSGDEVILAALDYPGNFRTIELLGARPVLVDVGKDSPCIDPTQLEAVASDRVRSVVASHLYGRSAEVSTLREICDRRGWILIEDVCQAAGMQCCSVDPAEKSRSLRQTSNNRAGSFGHFATISFGGSKLISAGNGGALLVNSDRLAARLGAIVDRPGDTFPLSPLQAAVIHPQLDRLDEINAVRNETARFLQAEVNPQMPRWRWLSQSDEHVRPAYYKVAWMAESSEHRERILEASESEGIPIGPGFRSMSRCSQRRCRKDVSLDLSDTLSETAFVLDHSALLIEPQRHGELADYLSMIYRSTL